MTPETKRALSLLSVDPIFSSQVKMFLDSRGKILGPIEITGTEIHSRIWHELTSAGNAHRFFDLKTNPMDQLPVWDTGNPRKGIMILQNTRPFVHTVETERFYTSLPSTTLTLLRIEENLFVGILRQRGIVPNIDIGGSGCIVYTDPKDRLVGFSETLLDHLDSRPSDPMSLLGQPADRFFSPGPSGLQRQWTASEPLQPRTSFQILYSADFRHEPETPIHCTRPEFLVRTAEGLMCGNPTDDFIYLSIPAPVDTRRDLWLCADCLIRKGNRPSIFLTRQPDPDLYTANTPDMEGYQTGQLQDRKFYVVKRRALLQQVGGSGTDKPQALLEWFKSGSTLRLFENRRLKIDYCDFEFIHHRAARAVIGIRSGSECLIRALRLADADPAGPPENSPIPMVRFTSAPARSALLARIDNLRLLDGHPEVSAWMLSNITGLETRIVRLEQENLRLQRAAGTQSGDFIGKSRVMNGIRASAARVAATDATILLLGPTGSGKEVLARYIHERSARSRMPFVKTDCSVISPALMESELFGHEKGAFTGAHSRHIGRFEQADGGTVFLDEAGNLGPEAQAKLLHFLQDRTITRVGGREPLRLDVRIIVASNVPLAEMVRSGRFREDLFFRIDVVTLNLPGLAERRDDLPELCAAFLDEFNRLHRRAIRGLTPAAHRKISGYGWPGNVRELRNTLERAVLFCDSEQIDEADIVFSMNAGGRRSAGRGPYRRHAVALDQVRQALNQSRGNLKAAADMLNVPRRSLYNLLSRIGVTAAGLRNERG